MTSDEYKECIDLIVELSQTGMICYDERQKRLLREFFLEIIESKERGK